MKPNLAKFLTALAHLSRSLLLALVGLALLLGLAVPSVARAAPARIVSNLVVTNLNDSGAGSLRQAVADAGIGDTITFTVTGMITLASQLVVVNDLTLIGPGPAALSISGSPTSRVIDNSAYLTISGLTIRGGHAGAGSGGGILNEAAGILVLTNTLITANAAQKGAGIYNSAGASLNLMNSAITNNQTLPFDAGLDASGAGLYNAGPGGDASISSSTFSGNDVHNDGSAFFNAGTAKVANSTFSLGQAAGTAAVYNDKNGALQLNNVTITVNTGKKGASGLFSAGGSVTLANSIVSDNHTAGSSASLPDCAGPLTSAGHNLVGNATGCGISADASDKLGSSAAPLDARLGPLTNNGGPTLTHSLLAGSPAINAGSLGLPGSGSSACESADQRGISRPQTGPAGPASDSRCDIGAVEVLVRYIYLPVSR